jgi:fibronectin type 3 domain-containing protein
MLTLAGCGGGSSDDGGPSNPTVQLAGVVAAGAPVRDATIEFMDENGNTAETMTDEFGQYSIDLDAAGLSLPVISRVPNPDTGKLMYSYASASGTSNVHPLTDRIIRTWFSVQSVNVDEVFGTGVPVSLPTETEVEIIKAVVTVVIEDLLTAAGVDVETFDLIETPFDATGSGFDMVLDNVTVDTNETTGEMNIVVAPDTEFATEVESIGGSTTTTLVVNSISFDVDTTAPSEPTGLSAAPLSDTQVLLTWSTSTDNVGVAYYKVYESTLGKVSTVTSTVFIVPGLSAGQTYTFTVKAFDAVGNSSTASASAPATTLGVVSDGIPPAAPSGLIANAVGIDMINLSWTTSTTDTAWYRIYRESALIAKVPTAGDITTITFTDFGLAPATTYNYVVTAVDAAGNESALTSTTNATTDSPATVTDTIPPTAPGELTAIAVSADTVDLFWGPAGDNIGVEGYKVYRAGSWIANSVSADYTDMGLTAGTQYIYTVSAYDFSGNESGLSNEASPTTFAADVSGLISNAVAALEAQNVGLANAEFKAAYMGSPGDRDANFGLALTDMVMLVEDPAVVNLIAQWGEVAPIANDVIWGKGFPTDSDGYGYCNPQYDPVSGAYIGDICVNCDSQHYLSGIEVLSCTQEDYTAMPALFTDCETEYAADGSITSQIGNGCPLSKTHAPSMKTVLSKAVMADKGESVVSEFNSLLDKLPKNKTSYSKKLSIAKSIVSAAITAPTPSEIQTVLGGTVLPVITSSISKLRAIQGTGFEFSITPAMTGDPFATTTVLDDGEFFVMDAVLSMFAAAINGLTAYNLDVDYNTVEADPLSMLYGPTADGATKGTSATNFFTLKTGGATKLEDNALPKVREAAAQIEKGYLFIKLDDADPLLDNGINFDGWLAEDHSIATDIIKAVKMALAEPVTASYTVSAGSATMSLTGNTSGDSVSRTETTEDSDMSASLTVDLAKAFANPLTRSNLPTLRYDLPLDTTLSSTYSEPVSQYVGPGFDGIQGTEDDDLIWCDIYPSTILPASTLTLNGIFPNGVPYPEGEDLSVTIDGMMYLSTTVLLDQSIRDSWQLTNYGSNLLTLVEDWYAQPPTRQIVQFSPTTGAIIDSFSLYVPTTFPPPAGTIEWINSIAHDGTNLWASGGYYADASGTYQEGVFQIDSTTGLATNPIPLVDTGTSPMIWDGLAGDGTNLYTTLHYHTNIVIDPVTGYETHDCHDAIVKFPTTAAGISTADIFLDDMEGDNMAYGGGYLWAKGLKIDPSTGDIVAAYIPGEGIAYLNGKLWDIEWDRVHSWIIP